eukprot:3248341-Lingulodinium_polyedra.AAC.1
MANDGWARRRVTSEVSARSAGASALIVNKLGLAFKTKAGGIFKHRLIWELPRSGANVVVRQRERVALPRLAD